MREKKPEWETVLLMPALRRLEVGVGLERRLGQLFSFKLAEAVWVGRHLCWKVRAHPVLTEP